MGTGESLVFMGDVESTITSSFKGSEDTVTGGGSDETNIEESLEWASLGVFFVTRAVVGSINFIGSLEHVVHLFVGQKTTGDEETSAIGSSIVGKSSGETVTSKLFRISSAHNLITGEGRVDNLGDDSFVSSAYAKSIFFGIVLILLLEDESLTEIGRAHV